MVNFSHLFDVLMFGIQILSGTSDHLLYCVTHDLVVERFTTVDLARSNADSNFAANRLHRCPCTSPNSFFTEVSISARDNLILSLA